MSKKFKKARISAGMVPTKERRKQNGGVVSEVIERDGDSLTKRYRAVWECPLDAYLGKGLITERQYVVGLMFRQAYHRAVKSKSAAQNRLALSSSTREGLSEKVLKSAYKKLSPHNMGSIIDICGHDLPAQDSVKLGRLQKGLGELADLWKVAAIEICGR